MRAAAIGYAVCQGRSWGGDDVGRWLLQWGLRETSLRQRSSVDSAFKSACTQQPVFQVRSLTLFSHRDMLHTYRRPGYDNHYDIPRQVEVYRCR